MGAVAKRLILRLSAPAKADHLAAGQAELLALGIEYLKVSLNADGAIVTDGYFCVWHEKPILTRARVTLAHVATDLLEINRLEPAPEALDRAATAIRRGLVVAIPTDALYTLVADPFSLPAVRKIYQAKGREISRALPMLVRDALMVEDLARDISSYFSLLARKFWPGPLTIILSASSRVPLRATGNTGRLAVRQARCKVTDGLIARLNQPLIATSANISGRPTCRSGIEVFGVMDGSIDLVLDGGLCEGVGATTVDITEPEWRLIKEGAITQREIADCLELPD